MTNPPDSQRPTATHDRVVAVRDQLAELGRPVTVARLTKALGKSGIPIAERTVRRALWLLWELDVVNISGDDNRRLWGLGAPGAADQQVGL